MKRSDICHFGLKHGIVCTKFFSSSPAVTEDVPSLVTGSEKLCATL